jgi:hypothetical protein
MTFSTTIAGNASPAQQRNSCATQLTVSCSALLLLAYAFFRYRYSRPLCGSCLVTSYKSAWSVQRALQSGLNCTNCPTWNLCIWITASRLAWRRHRLPASATALASPKAERASVAAQGRKIDPHPVRGRVHWTRHRQRTGHPANCPHGAALRSAGDCIDGRSFGSAINHV